MNTMLIQGQHQAQSQQLKRLLAMRAKLLIANVQNIAMVTRLELAENILVEDVVDPMVESLESDLSANTEMDFVNEIADNAEENMGYRMLDDGRELGDIPDDRKASLVQHTTDAEDLVEQLVDLHFTDTERGIADALIYALNDNGLLEDREATIEFLGNEIQVSEAEIRGVLDTLKASLVPAGVFAANIQESLMLQTDRLVDSPMKVSLIKVIDEQYDLLTQKDVAGVTKFLRLGNQDLVRDMFKAIGQFHATPFAGEISAAQQRSRSVDFVVSDNGGRFVVQATQENWPKIVVNDAARRLLHSMLKGPDTKDRQFALGHSEQLNALRETLRNRVRESETVIETILNHQASFLRSGDPDKIAVLLQAEVAEKANVHPSTVSRIIQNKNVEMENGAAIDLRPLTSKGFLMTTGKRVSEGEVKQVIREVQDKAAKGQILPDSEVHQQLKNRELIIGVSSIRRLRSEMHTDAANARSAEVSHTESPRIDVSGIMDRMGVKPAVPGQVVGQTVDQTRGMELRQ